MFIWFMYVHVIYSVTDPDRLLEPFSGSEVQRCARGLAAISKVPALSLENRQNLQK